MFVGLFLGFSGLCDGGFNESFVCNKIVDTHFRDLSWKHLNDGEPRCLLLDTHLLL